MVHLKQSKKGLVGRHLPVGTGPHLRRDLRRTDGPSMRHTTRSHEMRCVLSQRCAAERMTYE